MKKLDFIFHLSMSMNQWSFLVFGAIKRNDCHSWVPSFVVLILFLHLQFHMNLHLVLQVIFDERKDIHYHQQLHVIYWCWKIVISLHYFSISYHNDYMIHVDFLYYYFCCREKLFAYAFFSLKSLIYGYLLFLLYVHTHVHGRLDHIGKYIYR